MVELAICITVIGILAAISIPNISVFISKSRDTQRSSKVTVLSEALEKYYQQNGEYPTCSNLKQSVESVSSTVLKGIDASALAAPSVPQGVNSINCETPSANNFTYILDENKTYKLSYKTEVNDELKTVKGRYDGSAKALNTSDLTVIAGAGGSVSGGGNFDNGSSVTIVATPDSGYYFSSWTGDSGCSGSSSHVVVINSDKTCTANFAVINYTLALNTSGLGSFINCASEAGLCSFSGTSNVRYGAYMSWYVKNGVTGSTACTNANFGGDPIMYVAKSCQYQAAVSVSGAGVFSSGSVKNISASPSSDFVSWSGSAGCSGLASHIITIDSNKSCTANFSPKNVDLPAPPSAPAISATFSGNNAVGTASAVTCVNGTPEYQMRFNRTNTSSDGTWTSWTSWSATVPSMTQTALQGNKHTFEVVARCKYNSLYSNNSSTGSANVIMDINTPPAPTYAGPGSFSNGVYQVVNFISYCPTGTDIVNGTFVSNLSSTGNIWGPHPFGYNDYWTNWEGYTLTATYWGTYQCQTVFKASPMSPQGVIQVPVYSS